MKIILLSGGAGKRLWPLSNDERSKQYLKLLKHPTGKAVSMLQNTLHELRKAGLIEHTVIASSEHQLALLQEQLGHSIPCIIEPERRDTYPAIALSAAYLHSEWEISNDEVVVVIPVDGKADSAFYSRISQLGTAVEDGRYNIALLGVDPTYPSSKYGYLVPESDMGEQPYTIRRFVEKPDTATARQLIEEGSLWNCGIFAFRLGYLIGKLKEAGLPAGYSELRESYHLLPKTSFDYAVVEQETRLGGLIYEGAWEDMGNWEAISAQMDQPVFGHGLLGDGCENTHIINELDINVIVNGIPDAVIIAGESGILVTSKRQAGNIKPLVEQVKPIVAPQSAVRKLETLYHEDGSIGLQTNRIILARGERYLAPSQAASVQWLLASGEGVVDDASGGNLPLAPGHAHTIQGEAAFEASADSILIEIVTQEGHI